MFKDAHLGKKTAECSEVIRRKSLTKLCRSSGNSCITAHVEAGTIALVRNG